MAKDKIISLSKFAVIDAKNAREKIGVSRHTLARWANNGLLRRVERGLYVHPDSLIDPTELDFAVACRYFGNPAAIAGISALFYYGLTAQIPQQIWLVVRPNRKNIMSSTRYKYRCLRTRTTLNYGINKKKYFKITNIERTIVESLWFGLKIGQRHAINAARIALADGLTNEHKLTKTADRLGVQRTLAKYWESIAP